MPLPAATFYRLMTLALFAWGGCLPSSGATSALAYTLNLPCQANLATPEWLGHPVAGSGAFASLDLPLISPETGASLLVTITFREKEGGFLRLIWKSAQGEQVLSSNFYEGVAMDNQRTLLIPANLVQGGGTLSLQSGDTVLNVPAISFEWLEERTALVSPEKPEQQVISRLGQSVPVSALDGSAAEASGATLAGSLVAVPMTSTAKRIEQGVEFSLQLDGPPRAARISLEESGLPWGRHLVMWINQQRAGTITPEVPDLEDSGFGLSAGQTYVGWRRGSIFISGSLMRAGLNTVQISAETDTDPAGDGSDNDSTADQPLAVKHLVCQFDYTEAAATAAVPALDAATTPAASTPAATAPPASDEDIATPGASASAASVAGVPLHSSMSNSIQP